MEKRREWKLEKLWEREEGLCRFRVALRLFVVRSYMIYYELMVRTLNFHLLLYRCFSHQLSLFPGSFWVWRSLTSCAFFAYGFMVLNLQARLDFSGGYFSPILFFSLHVLRRRGNISEEIIFLWSNMSLIPYIFLSFFSFLYLLRFLSGKKN